MNKLGACRSLAPAMVALPNFFSKPTRTAFITHSTRDLSRSVEGSNSHPLPSPSSLLSPLPLHFDAILLLHLSLPERNPNFAPNSQEAGDVSFTGLGEQRKHTKTAVRANPWLGSLLSLSHGS